MSSQKPRIALTVPDEINDLLERLSDLTGTPKTKIIIEMLGEYLPVLSSIVETLEQVKADKENGKAIVKNFAQNMLLDANIKLGQAAKEASEL
jgi:predicted DNA-binding protein